MANCPAVITCTDVMADEHPQLVIAHLKAMIKVGRWANEHKHAAAVILNRQTFYRDVEDICEGIKHVDMVPNLSPQNLAAIDIGKDFMRLCCVVRRAARRTLSSGRRRSPPGSLRRLLHPLLTG